MMKVIDLTIFVLVSRKKNSVRGIRIGGYQSLFKIRKRGVEGREFFLQAWSVALVSLELLRNSC